jgi:hypothetical protein
MEAQPLTGQRKKPTKDQAARKRLARALNTGATYNRKAGQQRRTFDVKKVEQFGRFGCSHAEMASFFDTSEPIIHARMNEIMPELQEQRDLLPPDWGQFKIAYEKGKHEICRALRSKQIQMALGGNERMLVHLGQHWLGQLPAAQLDLRQEVTGEVVFTFKPAGEIIDLDDGNATKQLAAPPA